MWKKSSKGKAHNLGKVEQVLVEIIRNCCQPIDLVHKSPAVNKVLVHSGHTLKPIAEKTFHACSTQGFSVTTIGVAFVLALGWGCQHACWWHTILQYVYVASPQSVLWCGPHKQTAKISTCMAIVHMHARNRWSKVHWRLIVKGS